MEVLAYAAKCALLTLLGILAWEDCKTKTISAALAISGLAAGFPISILSGSISLWEIIAGCAVGGVMMLPAVFGKGGIGLGDGLAVAACGAWLGFYRNVLLLAISLLFMAVFGGTLMVLKKAGRKDELPFMPFLLAGYIFMEVLE